MIFPRILNICYKHIHIVFRLFHHLAKLIQNRIEDDRKDKAGAIDRKQRKQINEKKEAQGIKLE